MDIREQMSRLASSGLEFSRKQQAAAFMAWFAAKHGKEVRRHLSLGGDRPGEEIFIEHEKFVFVVQRTGNSPWRMKLLVEAPPPTRQPVLEGIHGQAPSGTPRCNLEGLMDLQLTPDAVNIPWCSTLPKQFLTEFVTLYLLHGNFGADIASRVQQLGQGLGFKVHVLDSGSDCYQSLCVCGPRRTASSCFLVDAVALSGVFCSVDVKADLEEDIEDVCLEIEEEESKARKRREIYAALRQKHNMPAPYGKRELP